MSEKASADQDLPVGNLNGASVPGDGQSSRTEKEAQDQHPSEHSARAKKQSEATYAEHLPDHIVFVRDFMHELLSTSAEIAYAARQNKTNRILKRKTDKAARDVQRQQDSEQMILVHQLSVQQKAFSATNAALRHENAYLERILKHARRLNFAEGSPSLAEDHRTYQLLHEELMEVEAARMKLLLQQGEAQKPSLGRFGELQKGEEEPKPPKSEDAGLSQRVSIEMKEHDLPRRKKSPTLAPQSQAIRQEVPRSQSLSSNKTLTSIYGQVGSPALESGTPTSDPPTDQSGVALLQALLATILSTSPPQISTDIAATTTAAPSGGAHDFSGSETQRLDLMTESGITEYLASALQRPVLQGSAPNNSLLGRAEYPHFSSAHSPVRQQTTHAAAPSTHSLPLTHNPMSEFLSSFMSRSMPNSTSEMAEEVAGKARTTTQVPPIEQDKKNRQYRDSNDNSKSKRHRTED